MSQSIFRVQDKAKTPLKVLKKKTFLRNPNPPDITGTNLNIIHFQLEKCEQKENTKLMASWEAQAALLMPFITARSLLLDHGGQV